MPSLAVERKHGRRGQIFRHHKGILLLSPKRYETLLRRWH